MLLFLCGSLGDMDVKITKEEFDRTSREAASVKPLKLFEQGIRSPMTLEVIHRPPSLIH